MIKDRNIDPSSNFPVEYVILHTCGTASATNTPIAQWCAPFAGKVVSVAYSIVSATATTGTIDIIRGTSPTATTGTSVFTAAWTNTSTTQTAGTLTSQLTTTTTQFESGEYLQLKVANAAQTKIDVYVGIRPLLAKELSGY